MWFWVLNQVPSGVKTVEIEILVNCQKIVTHIFNTVGSYSGRATASYSFEGLVAVVLFLTLCGPWQGNSCRHCLHNHACTHPQATQLWQALAHTQSCSRLCISNYLNRFVSRYNFCFQRDSNLPHTIKQLRAITSYSRPLGPHGRSSISIIFFENSKSKYQN